MHCRIMTTAALLLSVGLLIWLLAACGATATRIPLPTNTPTPATTPLPTAVPVRLVEARIESEMTGYLAVWNGEGERGLDGDFYHADWAAQGARVERSPGGRQQLVKLLLPGSYTFSFDGFCAKPAVECPAGTRPRYYSERQPLFTSRLDEETYVVLVHAERDEWPVCTWECE